MYKKVHCYYSFTSTLSSMYCYIQELVFLYEEVENSCVRLSKGSRRLGKRNCVGDNAALGRFFLFTKATKASCLIALQQVLRPSPQYRSEQCIHTRLASFQGGLIVQHLRFKEYSLVPLCTNNPSLLLFPSPKCRFGHGSDFAKLASNEQEEQVDYVLGVSLQTKEGSCIESSFLYLS